MPSNKEKCVCEGTDGYFMCGVKGVLAHVEDGKIISTIERCDLCCTFESDEDADHYLREKINGKGKKMNINELIGDILNSASDEGCSDDLTVISKNALTPFKTLMEIRAKNMDPESEGITHSFYTVAFGNAFDGIIMEGLFTDMDAAIEYAEKYAGESEWHVAPIDILH